MSVCSAKVRFALAEKGLEWTGRYTDIRKGEQKAPQYLKLNPNGYVPTLVHDVRVVIESTIINEYIEDAFPDPPLRPVDAASRAQMRLWTLQLDVDVHMATRVLTSSIAFRHTHLKKTPQELEAKLNSIQDLVKRERQRESYTKGVDSPFMREALKRYDKLLGDMEAALDHSTWLAGENFSLADIGYAPYVTRLEHLQLAGMWAACPRVADWFERLKARAGYQQALANWFNQDYINQMKETGAESWPRIKVMLEEG